VSVGTACAVEMCKPLLAWVLVSNAAERCQELGYHRFEAMKDDSEEQQRSKIHLFWMIYMFDKQLSLRLGRASQLQDWDMSLHLFIAKGASVNGFEGGDMLLYWAKVARIQGQIYERLYSPGAFSKTSTKRSQIADALMKALHTAWREKSATSVVNITNPLDSPATDVPCKRKRSSYEEEEEEEEEEKVFESNDYKKRYLGSSSHTGTENSHV
jgi:hypothetical protein